MNREGAIDRGATPSVRSSDMYRLLTTGRFEPSPAPKERQPPRAAAPQEDASAARYGSVYLRRWRFGSRRRRRLMPPLAAN